jgi:Flp pilus assembly protein CpaB
VNLIVTLPDWANVRRTVTKVFLQRVLILAVNQGYPVTGSTVTIAVSPDEVERVVSAKERGRISIVLWRPSDNEPVETRSVDYPLDASAGDTVEVYRLKPRPTYLGTLPAASATALTVKIWVAKRLLVPGTATVASDFELVSYPRALADKALTEKDDPTGLLQHYVPAGFPITRDHYGQASPFRGEGSILWDRNDPDPAELPGRREP